MLIEIDLLKNFRKWVKNNSDDLATMLFNLDLAYQNVELSEQDNPAAWPLVEEVYWLVRFVHPAIVAEDEE